MKTLTDYWAIITTNHNEIMAYASPIDEEEEYIKENLYENLEDAYQSTMIFLQECCDRMSIEISTEQPQSQKIKLPPIEVPNFNGNYHNWKSFHDLFEQLIHNNTTLGKVQKLQYLKANLSGEASKLLQHLQVSEANYDTAWELLNQRYNNTRLLVSTQLNTLLSQAGLQIESASGIKKLHDTTKECLLAINNLDIDTSGWDPIVVHIITQKLDKETQKVYEQSLKSPKEMQTLEELLSFLEMRFQTLEAVKERNKTEYYGTINKNQSSYRKLNYSITRKQVGIKGLHGAVRQKCFTCNGEHEIFSCKQFLGMTPHDRLQLIKKEKLCINCLKPNHDHRTCKSLNTCRVCRQKHNTLVHYETNPKTQPRSATKHTNTQEKVTDDNAEQEKAIVQYQSRITEYESVSSQVLLATAIVRVITKTGHTELLRTLIDQGSQATFITEDAAHRLGLPRNKIHANIGGLGTASAGIAKSSVHITVLPRFSSNFQFSTTALVLKKLTKVLPAEQIDGSVPSHIQTLLLADPTYDKPGPIDIILGADIFGKIILKGLVKGNQSSPIAQRTELGWILSGRILNQNNQKKQIHVNCLVAQSEIETQLRKFWELEEIPSERKLTEDEEECERLYETSTTRCSSGRYTVRLLFNPNLEKALGTTKEKAFARLLQMERKFTSNKEFERAYKDFMEEYITLGHMKPAEPLSEDIEPGTVFYIPHHAVVNPNSTTTKLRVVFDASVKSSTGVSLNDKMFTGPTLQQNLTDILMRWRRHKIAITSDIEKMYRQINIAKEDQNYQRILWRKNRYEPIKEYQLTTVTYGTRSAPYLAIKTLQRLSNDDYNKYPQAASVAMKDFYVDDLITGCDTIEESLKLQEQIINLLNGGGFKLRKWASNNPKLLEKITENDRNISPIQFDMDNPIKTLGILWHPVSDCFQFKVNMESTTQPATKRSLLSEASKLFDPLGWLSPTIIQAKIMFQELWKVGLTWDQELPEEIAQKWKTFKEELQHLETIRIPRWIEYEKTAEIELHGFCDASEKAYAAVIYTKTITAAGKKKVSLLTAKTKVAPISKPVSLPRLELCGASLLANLIKQAKTAMEIQDVKVYAYTDSTIVLAWLKGHPSKWKTFVANRVGEIQSVLNAEDWHHISSNDNPADCASRGLSPRKLLNHSLWWKGPQLLIEKKRNNNYTEFNTDLEVRKMSNHVATIENIPIINLLPKYSKFKKIIKIVAYCLRFITKSRRKPGYKGEITIEEMENAKVTILKLVQRQEFAQELKKLSNNEQVDKNSKLACLNPILDENGLIRVGGRLHNSELNYSTKHPIILPYKGPLTTLLIDQAHKETLHGGIELTFSHLRHEYWIIKGYSAVKQHLHKCTRCFRFRANTTTQIMGNLPAPRVTATRPFTNTGVDYAGPVTIRISKVRGSKTHKGYICIFVCLATKAIHLEAVSDLTAQAFLAAFKRFCGRRGNVSNIYSDNGTNFVLANKILQADTRSYAETYNKIIYDEMLKVGTQWHFIPPASPHFGGLWEAGVKSVKYHMKRIIGEHNLTFEELQTVLIQIEACLNSRPLCPITDDPECTDALTPGHFLIGSAIIAPPIKDRQEDNIHTLARWQLLDRLYQNFWKRWSKEYLSRLQQRPKWTTINNQINVGELVLVKDDQLPPTRWSLGRIIETHPGTDGLTRVVTIKTKGGILKRPLTKICSLPISDNLKDQTKTQTTNINNLLLTINGQSTSNKSTKEEQATLPNGHSIRERESSGEKRRIDYGTLIQQAVKKGKMEKALRNPKPIKIRPVTGYKTLVPKEIQEKATRDYTNRYRSISSKRPLDEETTIKSKFARRSNSCTLLHGTVLCLLLLFLTKLGRCSTQEIQNIATFNVIPFTDQPGIFFEDMDQVKMETNDWKIIVYFDLSSYWNELTSLQKRIRRLSTFCEAEEEEHIDKTSCTILTDQLKQQLIEIEHKNEILYQHNGDTITRQKRSPLNIVGNIANKLFGVLDEKFAAHHEEQIKKVKANQNHLLELLKNQTSIQEATSNIIKRTREELNQHQEMVEQRIQAIASSTNNFSTNQKKMEAFFLLVSHTMLTTSSYQNIQNTILNVIMDTQNGKISPQLLTPEQLQHQLGLIRSNLPENVVLLQMERRILFWNFTN